MQSRGDRGKEERVRLLSAGRDRLSLAKKSRAGEMVKWLCYNKGIGVRMKRLELKARD